jgi:hypothetical protein
MTYRLQGLYKKASEIKYDVEAGDWELLQLRRRLFTTLLQGVNTPSMCL